MKWLKTLLSKDESAAPRQLTQVDQLQVGDFIELSDSFVLPAQLRGQQLTVRAVTTTEFATRHAPCFELRGSDNTPLFLTVDEDDRDLLCFSLRISREQISTLFDSEQFAQVFEPGHCELSTQWQPQLTDALHGWVASHYWEQDDAVTGYFHQQDYRDGQPPQFQDEQHGEVFQYYSLWSEDEQQGIELEVYEGGDTEISLVICRPASDIRQLYPAS